MPVYEFECKKCHKKYEEVTGYDASGKYPGVRCPACRSKAKHRLISAFGIGGPTSSKLDNFEYRAGFNMEKAKSERRAAEAASHMGGTDEIFNHIDDMPDYEGKIV